MTLSELTEGFLSAAEKAPKQIKCGYLNSDEGIYMSWFNPWENKEETIASFFWPVHPASATTEVEELYENLADLIAQAVSTVPEIIRRQRECIKEMRGALETLEAGLLFPGVHVTPGTISCMKALARVSEIERGTSRDET